MMQAGHASVINTQAPVATVGGRRKTVTAIENVLNVMADVSVQNERINGWIPSSATNVIMNWPERIKTQRSTPLQLQFCCHKTERKFEQANIGGKEMFE